MNSFAKMGITWYRSEELERIDDDGEDLIVTSNTNFTPISLQVLVQANYFRTWPISVETQSGEQDSQNLAIYLHKPYLDNLGYVTSAGYFDFNPHRDYFIIEGKKYLSKGDTTSAHANTETLLFQINLLRDEIQSGNEVNP